MIGIEAVTFRALIACDQIYRESRKDWACKGGKAGGHSAKLVELPRLTELLKLEGVARQTRLTSRPSRMVGLNEQKCEGETPL